MTVVNILNKPHLFSVRNKAHQARGLSSHYYYTMAGVVSDKVLPQHSKRKVYHSSELFEPPKGSSS